jgi:uncharacterized small protein (DUF1192 family)
MPPSLVHALRSLLRPLVRLLLDYRLPFTYVAELLKGAYVEVATRELTLHDRPQTDSRVSLLTGVHRREVKRLRGELPHDEQAMPASVDFGTQLALRWTTEPPYCDPEGQPLPLPRSAADPEVATFDRLVQSVSKDIRPRAVLDEWLRLGVAVVDTDQRICLRVGGFIPQQGFEEKAFYFGRNLRDHIATAAANLRGELPPRFERSVYYEGLSPESIEELEKRAGQLSMEVLRKINRRAAELKRRDARRKDRSGRMTLGIYFERAKLDEPDGR